MAEALPVRMWTFVAVCAIAGALAVPPHAVASLVASVVAGLTGLLGLWVWRWSRLPSLMEQEAPHGAGRVVQTARATGFGLVVGLLMLGVIRLAVEPAVPAAGVRLAAAAALPLWRRVVIIYVAAVGEEVVFRLLLLSLVAGLSVRLFRRADGVPNRGIVWLANVLSALAFGAAHLPAWSAVGAPSLGLALIILALNGLGGVVFGHLYVKHGITAAMWAHAGADCVIQLVGPLTG